MRVTPRAAANRVVLGEAGEVKVWVTAPPVDDRANAAVVDVIAAALGISRSGVRIASGARARSKRVLVDGMSPDEARAILRERLRS